MSTNDMSSNYFFWPEWVGPFESIYSIAHKFMWVNNIRFAEMCAFFGVRIASNYTLVSTSKSFLQADWICERPDSETLFKPPVPTIAEIKRLIIDGQFGGWSEILSVPQFRFCRDCLDFGFHSSMFQLRCLSQCPLHNVLLTSQCPKCHRALSDFGFNRFSFSRSCGCANCDFSWAPIPGQLLNRFDQIAFYAAFREAIQPVADWLESLPKSKHHIYPKDNFNRSLQYLGLPSQDIHYFYARHLVGPIPLESNSEKFASTRIVEVKSIRNTDSKPDWEVLKSFYCAIRRHIESKFLRPYRSWFSEYRSFDLLAHLKESTSENCFPPMILAYGLWRTAIESETDARRSSAAASLSKDVASRFFCDSFVVELSRAKSLPTEETVAQILLSYFFGICSLVSNMLAQKEDILTTARLNFDFEGARMLRSDYIGREMVSWFRGYMLPYLDIFFDNGENHSLQYSYFQGTPNDRRESNDRMGSLPIMVASSAAMDNLRGVAAGLACPRPWDAELLQAAVDAGLLSAKLFAKPASFSIRQRRRLQRRLNFVSSCGSVRNIPSLGS